MIKTESLYWRAISAIRRSKKVLYHRNPSVHTDCCHSIHTCWTVIMRARYQRRNSILLAWESGGLVGASSRRVYRTLRRLTHYATPASRKTVFKRRGKSRAADAQRAQRPLILNFSVHHRPAPSAAQHWPVCECETSHWPFVAIVAVL